MDAPLQILVVGPNHGVAEIPGMFGKGVVGNIVAQGPKILDEKDCGGSGVALSKHMDLPQVRNESGKMPDDFVCPYPFIGKMAFLFKIVLQSGTQFIGSAIENGIIGITRGVSISPLFL